MEELEQSAERFLTQIKSIKLNESKEISELNQQITKQQDTIKDLSQKYENMLKQNQANEKQIQDLKLQNQDLLNQIEDKDNKMAVQEAQSEELKTEYFVFLEDLKKVLELPNEKNLKLSSVVEYIQTEYEKWKRDSKELERTKNLMNEIGKYFNNNTNALSTSENVPITIIKTDVDVPSNLATDLPTNNHVQPSSSKQFGPDFETAVPSNSSSLGGSSNSDVHVTGDIRARKQLTPYVKTKKVHGKVPGSTQFRCYCGYTYKSRIGLHVHVRKMTQKWDYKCHHCKQFFFYASELKNHLRSSITCGQNLGQEKIPDSKANSWTIDNKLPFQNSQPNRLGTGKPDNLNRRKPNGMLWTSKNLLRTRTILKNNTGKLANWKFTCQICNSNFQYLAYLKKHMAGTHNEPHFLKEFVRGCQLCGDMFHTNQLYWEHRAKVHHLKRKSSSSKLSPLKDTKAPDPLVDPTLTLTEGPEFITAHSSKDIAPTKRIMIERYLQDQAKMKESHPHTPLEAQMNDLDGILEQKCSCGKLYQSRTALMLHVNSMKYGMIFKCLECGKGFSQLVNLQSHSSAVHKEECDTFACGLCNELFSSRKEFRLHCQAEHENVNNDNQESS